MNFINVEIKHVFHALTFSRLLGDVKDQGKARGCQQLRDLLRADALKNNFYYFKNSMI